MLEGKDKPTPKEMGAETERGSYDWERQLQTRFNELYDKDFDGKMSEEERAEFKKLSKVMLLLERM